MEKVGKITHFYGKIGVAIIELAGDLKAGDKIRIGGEDGYEQAVESMQVEHEPVQEAKAGDVVGLKVDQKAEEGWDVFKID